jgi:hypothetical protein
VYNKAYINKRVLFNVLSTVLKQPFIDGILYILTYISLICDPYALVYMLDNVLIPLPLDLYIINLK